MDAERDLAAEFRRGWEWMMKLQGCVGVALAPLPPRSRPEDQAADAASIANAEEPS
jgi:hypothetical protein